MSQATRILLALVAGLLGGIALAAWAPGAVDPVAAFAQPVGTAWLNALQMTIVPLVVSLLITGVAATAEAARAGRLAGRAIALYVAILAASAAAGAILTPLFLGLVPLPAESAANLRAALTGVAAIPPAPPLGDFLRRWCRAMWCARRPTTRSCRSSSSHWCSRSRSPGSAARGGLCWSRSSPRSATRCWW